MNFVLTMVALSPRPLFSGPEVDFLTKSDRDTGLESLPSMGQLGKQKWQTANDDRGPRPAWKLGCSSWYRRSGCLALLC